MPLANHLTTNSEQHLGTYCTNIGLRRCGIVRPSGGYECAIFGRRIDRPVSEPLDEGLVSVFVDAQLNPTIPTQDNKPPWSTGCVVD